MVPMISGRGLGHTGGTIDKLESIPGFKTDFTRDEMNTILANAGAFIVSPTKNMVPADKILYATRDTTGTVDNQSLITASIMSKKAAEGLDALLLQITFGKAAFMKNENDARSLGRSLISIGNIQGIKTTGILMRMDEPLGRAVGNSLEVIEAIKCLRGGDTSDLHEVVCKMGGQLLLSMNKVQSMKEGEDAIDEVLRNGEAKRKFIQMAVAQGADLQQVEQLCQDEGSAKKILPASRNVTRIFVEETGYVHSIDAMVCGCLAHQLGAGRTHPGDQINPAVGLLLHKLKADFVNKGDIWVEVHHDEDLTETQKMMIRSAIEICPEPPSKERLTRIVDYLK